MNVATPPITAAPPLLEVRNLEVHFPFSHGPFWRRTHGAVRAVDGVSFTLREGETLGLVGESGCGKSTTARACLNLVQPTGGEVLFRGRPIQGFDDRAMLPLRREMQMIFQDPFASLNPRMTVGRIVGEPLVIFSDLSRRDRELEVMRLLELVGLNPRFLNRYPHEFSGGQRQRIGIARALAVEPEVLVADELVSALDVSVQAQVVNLLLDLQERLHLTVVFVAHDLRLVRHISHRVAVMYLGKVVEIGPTEALFSAPRHPYTRALLDAAPELDPARRSRKVAARGELPSPINLPQGCLFHTRCPHAFDRCRTERPELSPRGTGHLAACHLADFGKPETRT